VEKKTEIDEFHLAEKRKKEKKKKPFKDQAFDIPRKKGREVEPKEQRGGL